MTKVLTRGGLIAGLFALTMPFAGGCNKSEPTAQNAEKAKWKEAGKEPGAAGEKDDHSGWWCKEHGIPEEECSMCSDEYAKKCKEKGDWCEKHDRAASQCFICSPELREKFAAKYRAKYGTEPPPIKGEKAGGPGAAGAPGAPGAPVGATPTATRITLPDMDCEACAEKLVKKMNALAGVAKAEADVKAQTLTVTPKGNESPSPKALWEACAAAGYDPSKLEGPGGVFTAKPKD
jgi:copper chaperone CopZ